MRGEPRSGSRPGPQRAEGAEAEHQIASAERSGEHLRLGAPGLVADPAATDSLRRNEIADPEEDSVCGKGGSEGANHPNRLPARLADNM